MSNRETDERTARGQEYWEETGSKQPPRRPSASPSAANRSVDPVLELLEELAMGGGFDQRRGAGGQQGPRGASSPGLDPGKRTLTEQLPVQCSANSAETDGAVQKAATQGIASGGPLPHANTIQRLFGRHSISGVEAHVGGPAATASRAIGDESGDAHEQHANAVADAVVQGKSAETLLDRYVSSSGSGSPAVQRKPDDAPSPQQEEGAQVGRLIQWLAAPAAAPAGHDDAYTLLSSLGIPELLATMEGVADCGYLPQLHARVIRWTNPFTAARLLSALYAVELVRVPPATVATEQLKAAGMALDLPPQAQQIQIVEYVLHHRGAGVSVIEVFEGALAMRDGKDAAQAPQAHGGGAVAAGATTSGAPPAPIEPGPWAPPGEQPIPFYIGNGAHTGIALHYQAAHRGEPVATNASPLKSILESLVPLLAAQGQKVDKSALADGELGLMPDITNLKRLHLYEIKPPARCSSTCGR